MGSAGSSVVGSSRGSTTSGGSDSTNGGSDSTSGGNGLPSGNSFHDPCSSPTSLSKTGFFSISRKVRNVTSSFPLLNLR